MVAEPAHLGGRLKPCPRCKFPDTRFRYFNNKRKGQPRYECDSCESQYTYGGRLLPLRTRRGVVVPPLEIANPPVDDHNQLQVELASSESGEEDAEDLELHPIKDYVAVQYSHADTDEAAEATGNSIPDSCANAWKQDSDTEDYDSYPVQDYHSVPVQDSDAQDTVDAEPPVCGLKEDLLQTDFTVPAFYRTRPSTTHFITVEATWNPEAGIL